MTYENYDNEPNIQRWLTEIRSNIYLARSFVEGQSYERFCRDTLVFYGVSRCVELIAASCRHLPKDLKARHEYVPWTDIAKASSVIFLVTTDVYHRLVWACLQDVFPLLLAAIENEICAASSTF